MEGKRTIGILGGMGPEASSYFYHLLIERAHLNYGAVQDTDFPPIVIYSLPLYGFNETGIVDAELVRSQLVDGVRRLEQSGSGAIIIACNTVHLFYDDMQAAVTVPIFSIIGETCRAVAEAGYRTVGLLSSESTGKTGLYREALGRRNVSVVPATDSQQRLLNEIILKVMGGTNSQSDTEALRSVVENMKGRGAQAVVLGCTELPLALAQRDTDVELFNSNQIIVDRALRWALRDS